MNQRISTEVGSYTFRARVRSCYVPPVLTSMLKDKKREARLALHFEETSQIPCIVIYAWNNPSKLKGNRTLLIKLYDSVNKACYAFFHI